MISTVDNITVLPVGEPGPTLLISGRWNVNKEYTRDSEVIPLVEHEGLFYSLNKVGIFKGGLNPKDDYAKYGAKATWKLQNSYEMIIVKAIVADGGNLGAFVFWENNIYSQHGTDVNGNPSTDFQNYPLGTFIPNWRVDGETGISYSNGAVMNNAFVRGSLVTPFVDAVPASTLEIDKGYNYLFTAYSSGPVAYNLPTKIKAKHIGARITLKGAQVEYRDYYMPTVNSLNGFKNASELTSFPLVYGSEIVVSPTYLGVKPSVQPQMDELVEVTWELYINGVNNGPYQTALIQDDKLYVMNFNNYVRPKTYQLPKDGNQIVIPTWLLDIFPFHTIIFKNPTANKEYFFSTNIVGRKLTLINASESTDVIVFVNEEKSTIRHSQYYQNVILYLGRLRERAKGRGAGWTINNLVK